MRASLVVALVMTAVLMVPASFASVDYLAYKLERIRDQQTQLQIEVRAGKGAFKGMSELERDALLAKQERVLSLLRDKQDFRQLSKPEQLEVINTLEDIKAVVAQAKDERQVCERIKTVASNVPQVVCMTARQRREQREHAQRLLEQAAKCFDDICIADEPKG